MTSLYTFLGVSGFDSNQVPHADLPLPNQLVGLELEVDQERNSSNRTVMPSSYRPEWTRKSDGSLNDGYEFVLTGPLAGQTLVQAIHKLYSGDTEVHRTYTGSTHIHLNMLDGTTLENLQALALLTYAMEGLLYYVGDNSRQWCGYANRMTGAPHVVLESLLGSEVQRRGLRAALNQAGRYYGLNLAALEKFGTVEFRYFPTATSAEEMLSWVKLVQVIKKAACDLGNIAAVIDVLSDKGKYSEFISTYLADYTDAVEASCPFSKVRVLANKALVIANARTTTQAVTWDKEVLASVFFRKPKLSLVPTAPSIPIKFLNGGTSSAVPTAGVAMAEANNEGFTTVVMVYNNRLYYPMNYSPASPRYDWNEVRFMEGDIRSLYFESMLNVARANGATDRAINFARDVSATKGTVRHARFVSFSGERTSSSDDYDEPESDHYDEDEEEDY